MILKKISFFIGTLSLISLSSLRVQAQHIVNVTEQSSFTRWTFSGSDIASGSGTFRNSSGNNFSLDDTVNVADRFINDLDSKMYSLLIYLEKLQLVWEMNLRQ